jgi:UDP-N-acetylglucosamine acyltransferase
MSGIHPSAIVEDGAKLGADVVIGPYCVVGPNVELGDRVELASHVVVDGYTRVGEGTRIFPHASIGLPPQDLKYKGEKTCLTIGKNNVIREHATMHLGTASGKGETHVGDNCLFMVNTHVAHDCKVGNSVVMANNAVMGGHVSIDDFAIIGGNSAIQQFVRIGKHVMVGGMCGCDSDVIPYGSVAGLREGLAGLNLIGLRRRGFTREEIHTLRRAYRLMFAAEGTLTERVNDVAEMFAESKLVMEVIAFIRADASRPIMQPAGYGRGA